MNTGEVLNIFLILAIIIITSSLVFVAFYLVQALKSITQLADDLNETTQSIKDKVQMKALAAIPALLVTLVSKIIKKRRG